MILITAAIPDAVSLLERFTPPGTWDAAVDLTNAFFSIPINEDHWRQLSFSWQGQQCTSLSSISEVYQLSRFHHNLVYRDLDHHSLPHDIKLVQESQWYSSSYYWYLLMVNVNTAKHSTSVYLSYSSQQPLEGGGLNSGLCRVLTHAWKHSSHDLQCEWLLIQVCSAVALVIITIYKKGNQGMNKWSNLPVDTQLGRRA